MSDSDKPKKEDIDHEKILQGKALKIYWYLSTHRRAGVRKIQRALKLSSPGTVSYQIDKLMDAGIISKNQKDGKYYVKKEVKMGILGFYFHVGIFMIPRYSLYLVINIMGFVGYFFYAILYGNEFIINPGSFLFLFSLIFSTFVFIFESKKVWERRPTYVSNANEMKIGKHIVLVGSLITLLSTFYFSFAQVTNFDGRTLSSGIGFLFNLPEIWGNPQYWIDTFPYYYPNDTMLIYLYSILYLFFIFSGFIQLVGLKSKYVGIFGSCLTIAFGIVLIIYFNDIDIGDIGRLNRFSALFLSSPIIEGILPLDIPIVNIISFAYLTISLGTITLFIGGSLGLVGGILCIIKV